MHCVPADYRLRSPGCASLRSASSRRACGSISTILLYALISLISPGQYSPVSALLDSLCEPVLRPFRRLIPAVAGLDLSPLWALIALQALLILLRG